MLSDLNRVDFGNVQEQASWVCNPCSGDVVKTIEVSILRVQLYNFRERKSQNKMNDSINYFLIHRPSSSIPWRLNRLWKPGQHGLSQW